MNMTIKKISSFVAVASSVLTAVFFFAQPVLAGFVNMPSGTTYDLYGLAMSTDGTRGIVAGGSFLGSALKWSSNGGRTWNSSSAAGTTIMRAVSFAPNSQTAWAVGGSGKILKTTNGGSSFEDQTANASAASGGATFYGVFALNTYTVYAVGTGGKIIKSFDGGLNWTSKTSGTTNTLRDVYFTDEDYGWIVGDGGVIIKTTNEGFAWSPQTSNSGTLRSVYFLDRNTGYAVGDNRTLIKTITGGSTWFGLNVSSVPSGTTFNSVNFLNTSNGMIGGSNGIIVETTDGATNWNTLTTGTMNSFYKVLYSGAVNAKFAAGVSGTILKYDAGDPPSPTSLAFSNGSSVTNSQTPTFVWSQQPDPETSIAKYYYYLFNGGNMISSGYTNSVDPSFTINVASANKFKLIAVDAAENSSPMVYMDFTYDGTAPTVGSPSPAVATAGQGVTISATYSDSQTTVTSCSLFVDDVLQATMHLASGTASVDYSFPSSGMHVAKVTCTDNATNSGSNSTNVNVAAAPVIIPNTTPSTATSQVSASPTSVVADDSSTATITVTVKNASSTALSGKTVSVSSSRPGSDTITAASPTTDASGQAVFTVRSSLIGSSSITAVADSLSVGTTNVSFTTPPPIPSNTNISASKSVVVAAAKKVKATGSQTGKVVVVVKNSSGQVLSGKTVTLTSSFNSVTFSQTQLTTNSSGLASFNVGATAPGSATFTATVNGTVLDMKPIITFVSPPVTACVSPVVAVGSLVKLPDDGNVLTQEDTAVYFYGYDCKRHAFPNSKVYFTWYSNFNNVVIVSLSSLASMPLGSNVRYRPGIRMVKFTTVNKVYAVSLGGELRWVTSESVATALYGSQWNKAIDDISDAFYTNYTFGPDVSDAVEYQGQAETDNATSINDDL
jgi:photosystem II stability/assembly factor-like uncharacterized protein